MKSNGRRITPAWAGKSRPCEMLQLRHTDHPRVGGEKQTLGSTGHGKPGSPPRGRGKVNMNVDVRIGKGITPAWAGKRRPASGRTLPYWDHPRVGGEKGYIGDAPPALWGSPPRGRGKGRVTHFDALRIGITPAWAGKRQNRRTVDSNGTDHPRVGGEKRSNRNRCMRHPGSPPRGRGKAGLSEIPM